MGSARNPQHVRFADCTLDLRTAELCRNGDRITLQDQPFQILAALLENPGQLVTREELIKRLWPSGTFVDFDQSLNKAVARLREALGDSAEKPAIVETLPRKGYRLIAALSEPEKLGPETTGSGTAIRVATGDRDSEDREKSRTLRVYWILALAISLLAGGADVVLRLRTPALPKVVGSLQITNDGLPKSDLVTDGSRIYFTETIAGHTILSQVSTLGGEASQIPTPFTSFRLGGLSPDGTELLVTGSPTAFPTGDLGYEFPLWILLLPNGTTRRVGDIFANDAIWSRDAKYIVYSHRHELYLCDRDGSNVRQLAAVTHYPLWPRWSPTGKNVIRFTEYDLETNGTSLWEVGADGTGLHRLITNWSGSQACCGYWTPDGNRYVFRSQGNLWVLTEPSWLLHRGNRPVQLTFGPLALTGVAPSHDGRKLFVVGQQQHAELIRYDSHIKQFVPYLSGVSGGQADFSRNTEWVAYISYPDETLWRCKTDGSQRQQLTYAPLRAALPRWSPDGTRIAFMGAETGKSWKIYLYSVATGVMQDAIPNLSNVGDPNWSADGQTIVFGFLAVDATVPPTALQLLDLRTHHISILPGSEGMFSPRWSPDGRYLIALTGDSQQMMLLEVASGKWSSIARQTIGYPTWSRNSKSVFFDDTSFTSTPAFYRVGISNRKLERVVGLDDIRQFATEWPFGAWTGLAPDDSPLLQRDISTQEIYALDLQQP